MAKDKFKVVLIGIIFDPKSRKILVGKNFGDKIHSFLEGELEKNEELDVCLKKVAKEKTGYKVHNLGSVYAKNKIKGKSDRLELYFLCEATEGKEKPGKKVEELVWLKPSHVERKIKQKLPSRLREYILGLE
jgi:ADP-ribose pyrophosphatase YjhB (NUDIX family)